MVAASIQHADRVNAKELDGEPAQLLLPLLSRLASSESSARGRILILPLFIADSRVLLVDVPAAVAAASGSAGGAVTNGDGHGKRVGAIGGRDVVVAPALGGDSDGVDSLAALLETEVMPAGALRSRAAGPALNRSAKRRRRACRRAVPLMEFELGACRRAMPRGVRNSAMRSRGRSRPRWGVTGRLGRAGRGAEAWVTLRRALGGGGVSRVALLAAPQQSPRAG